MDAAIPTGVICVSVYDFQVSAEFLSIGFTQLNEAAFNCPRYRSSALFLFIFVLFLPASPNEHRLGDSPSLSEISAAQRRCE